MNSNLNDILQIDFVNYLEKNGFQISEGNKNTVWLKMENPSTGEKLRLKKLLNNYVYTNNHDANERGNIVNFVINRLNGGAIPNPHPTKEEFAQALSILEKEIGVFSKEKTYTNQQATSQPGINVKQIEEDRAKAKNIDDKIAILECMSDEQKKYLYKQRSISRETLERPELRKLIKAFPKELATGHIIKNTAFVKRNLQGEVKGFTIHYYSAKDKENKKINYQHKDCGICRTEITPNSKGLIIGESIVDCISHLQLFKEKLDSSNKNFVYCAFEGTPSPQEYNEIYQVYKKLKEDNPQEEIPIVSITDNDKIGYGYDLSFAIYLWNEEHPQNQININYFQDTKEIFLPINIEPQTLYDDIVTNLKNSQEEPLLDKIAVEKTNKGVKVKVPVIPDNIKTYKCKFLSEIAKVIHKANNINYSQHKSQLKDWNDELKQSVKKNNNLKINI